MTNSELKEFQEVEKLSKASNCIVSNRNTQFEVGGHLINSSFIL